MNVEYAYFFKNASVLLTHPVEFGDLLAVINKMQQVRFWYSFQIFIIIAHLYSNNLLFLTGENDVSKPGYTFYMSNLTNTRKIAFL